VDHIPHPVTRGRGNLIQPTLHQLRRLLALVLQARQGQMSEVVEGRVIHVQVLDEGEVEARQTRITKKREVRVVGQALVDLGGQGCRRGVRNAIGIHAHQVRVAATRLKHIRHTRPAPSLEVQDQTHVLAQGMVKESRGAHEPLLLRIRKEKDNRLPGPTAFDLHARQFEQYAHSGEIVGHSGPSPDGVVMSHAQENWTCFAAIAPGEDVVNGPGHAPTPHGKPALLLGLISEQAQMVRNARAHLLRLGAACRVRPHALQQPGHGLARPLGRKLIPRGRCRQGCRGVQPDESQEAREHPCAEAQKATAPVGARASGGGLECAWISHGSRRTTPRRCPGQCR
jgi:hypothetical protein